MFIFYFIVFFFERVFDKLKKKKIEKFLFFIEKVLSVKISSYILKKLVL